MSPRVLLLTIFITCCVALAGAQLVGNLREENAADEEVRGIVMRLRNEISRMARKEYKEMEPISYRKQVVAGMNYFVKTRALEADGTRSYVHVRVYKPFRGDYELTSVKTDVDESQGIGYFR